MILALIFSVALAIPVLAGGGGRGGRGAPGGGAAPAAATNDMAVLQKQLRATEEEWKVIGPLVERLTEATEQLDPNTALPASSGGMGNDTFNGPGDAATGSRGGGGRGGRGGPGAPAGAGGPDPAAAPPSAPVAAAAAHAPAANTVAKPDEETGSDISAQTINFPQAIADLKSALADKTSSEPALKEKLAIVRAARVMAEAEIERARKQLRQILTADQEAKLVALGYME